MQPPSNNRLVEIESNIRRLKADVARDLIEIGNYLIEAKSLVKHGEWSSWLENNVGFSVRTAQNYMRLAHTFSGMGEEITSLDVSKLFLLQEMPLDERGRFLAENDVATMSVRQLKRAIQTSSTAAIPASSTAPEGAGDGKSESAGESAGESVDEVESKDDAVGESEDDDPIWSVFDKVRDDELYRVPVRLLKPIERYEEYFKPRVGEEYIEYLHMMKSIYESYEDRPDLQPRVIITRDYTVLVEQETVRAYRDLGIEEITATYATLDSKVRIKGMTIEEEKISMSLSLHHGGGADKINLIDSLKKFRAEMLAKGVDVFGYVEK